MSFSYLEGPLIKIFRIDAPSDRTISFLRHYIKMTGFLLFIQNRGQSTLMKGYERGTLFQLKVHICKRGTVKMAGKRVRGWISGRSLPL